MTSAPEDDERTIIGTSARPPARPQEPAVDLPMSHTLPAGTRLGEFEIVGLIGEGGFGIVYLAYDPSLQRQVALKEYMPSALASRSVLTATVAPKSERHLETFNIGLRSFVNEARLLARFDHPALVKVHRFWEANGTAYMVMPYYKGPTLKRALAERRQAPDEATLRGWLQPLLDALAVMHAEQCFHRDIAPDNILLTDSGPLLLDFGAARRVVGDMTHALTVVLKPGYAPIEQYGEVPSMTQGAWTDLYALACVVYYAITGKTPMSSVERLIADRLEPLSRIAAGRYSDRFLHAIDAALAVKPQDRPQDVASFRALLGAPPAPAAAAAAPAAAVPAGGSARRLGAPLLGGGLLLLAVAGGGWFLTGQRAARAPAPAPVEATAIPPRLPAAEPAPAAPAVPAAAPTQAAAAPPSPQALPSAAPPQGPQAAAPAAVDTPPAPARSDIGAAPVAARPSPPPPGQAKAEASGRANEPAVPRTQAAALSPRPDSTLSARPKPRAEAPPANDVEARAPRSAAVQTRCSDILQKASLEALTDEETVFLKRQCK
ncbi:serine/threonine protein kinase [Eleftheria terrae]|uniref:serine/threonine protein kinase n=1 Tax=Eleftheria terrae TaxID=1597781 RepID=UPI00263B8AA6|nr:serine/threonine protein kinase [Eleftheria terrae]WKB51322.1 protein kinase [Eleftheria terrae]